MVDFQLFEVHPFVDAVLAGLKRWANWVIWVMYSGVVWVFFLSRTEAGPCDFSLSAAASIFQLCNKPLDMQSMRCIWVW